MLSLLWMLWQLESYVRICCGPHQQWWVRNSGVCHFFRAMLKYKKVCNFLLQFDTWYIVNGRDQMIGSHLPIHNLTHFKLRQKLCIFRVLHFLLLKIYCLICLTFDLSQRHENFWLFLQIVPRAKLPRKHKQIIYFLLNNCS